MRSFFQTLIALALLVGLAWAAWQGFTYLQNNDLGLKASRVVLITVGILAVMCTFMIASAIRNHGAKNLWAHQFDHRMALYENCLSAWLQIDSDFTGTEPVKLDVQLKELEGRMLLLASPGVIRAFLECKRAASADGVNTSAATAARQRLLWAMREDLGQPGDYLLQRELFKSSK